MTFPDTPFKDAAGFVDAYASAVADALVSIDRQQFETAAKLLATTYDDGRTVYVCGNGGSAAIANHLHCDHLKGIQTDTDIKPRVVSLVSGMETITAIANDIAYADIFVYQLRTLADAGDVLITVSSSGDSENIVRAAAWAKENGIKVLALTGFAGGRSASMADVNVHVAGDNYGIIEDAHQSVMHMLAQFIRMQKMSPEAIRERKF